MDSVKNIDIKEMKNLVIERLKTLSYIFDKKDEDLIHISMSNVDHYIKRKCNISKVSNELFNNIFVDLVCYEFLIVLKQIGKLDDVFNIETAIKSVQAGDTNISFDTSGTNDNRLDVLLKYLERGRSELVSYRKIKW